MTFRELSPGETFRFANDPERVALLKISPGMYHVGGWSHVIRPEKRDVEVVRIEAPKENEK